MIKSTVVIALLLAFFAFSAPAKAESEGCMEAVAVLDDFLLSLPNTCNTDEECGGFFLRADTCAPAVMLPLKLMHDQETLRLLVHHQMDARKACEKDTPQTCKPKPYKPACENNVCVNQWVKN